MDVHRVETCFVLQAAGNISTDAAETKERAIQLNDEARQLSNDVDGATLNLENYEQQADEDAQLVREVRVALLTRGIRWRPDATLLHLLNFRLFIRTAVIYIFPQVYSISVCGD